MIQKTIITTLLALLSGAPFLKAQTIDTTSADTLISITDSLIHKWVKEIDKGIQVQEGVIYRMPEDSMMVFSRDTFRMVKRRRRITKATIEETKQYWGYNSQIIDEASMKTIPTSIGDQSNFLPELNNAKSVHWGIEQQWGFNLIRGKVRVFTGIRYDIHNYRFQNPYTRLTQDQPEFTAVEIGGPLIDPIPVEKSKLVVNYIGIPVSLGFQDKPGDNSKFSAKIGVHAGYRVRTHTKIKQSGGNVEKQFDDFNMNDFYLSPFVNVNYGDMGLYMRYPLTNLFKDGQGANTQSVQFGITLKMS
jgi:hypothetical protein